MKSKRFKFRYANELTGAFVVLAVMLSIAGVILVSHSQRWLEGTIELRAIFSTEEGAFGLQEGNEVKVRNIVAGHVERIVPTPKGNMMATLVLKKEYQQFIFRNSVGYVGKVYGLAGASYVGIRLPDGEEKGQPVRNGDSIVCVKDKALMAEATRMLGRIEESVLPVAERAEALLRHSASIAQGIDEGDGLAGTLVRDEEFADETRRTMGQVSALTVELQEMASEITCLVKGMQKSWFVRKHIDQTDEPLFLYPMALTGADLSKMESEIGQRLNAARAADHSSGIVLNAYNLAMCALERRDYPVVTGLLPEIRAELAEAEKGEARALILESQMARLRGKREEASALAKKALESVPRDDREFLLLCRVLIAESQCDQRDRRSAASSRRGITSLLKKAKSPVLKAMAAHSLARIAAVGGDLTKACDYYDAQASHLRSARLYPAMAMAIQASGLASEEAGLLERAADRYFRAGRTLVYEQRPGEARGLLERSAKIAAQVNDEYLITQSSRLLAVIDDM